MFLSTFSTDQAFLYCLAFVRVLAVALTLPKLGSHSYFLFFRILLAGAITLSIAPLITSQVMAAPPENFDWLSQILGELGIGMSLGLAGSCVIIGLNTAGQIVSQLLGFQVGSLQQGLDADQNADFRKLFFVVGICFWFGISGHRIVLEGLLQSFRWFEVGQLHFSAELFSLLNGLVTVCLEFAIRFSLPVVVVSLAGFLIAGFASRILGSGQSTSVAFAINQLLFFLIAVPLLFVFSEEVYRETTSKVESVIISLTQRESTEGQE